MKSFMEQLNRIEIRGTVGNVKLQTFTDNEAAWFSVATNYAYKDKSGNAVIDTAWHNVVAREGRNIKDLRRLEKGAKVYVQGRLRYQKYSSQDGTERWSSEIIASRLVFIDSEEPMQYEML